jgi:hypothetical protein
MKKLILFMLMAALMIPFAVFAEEESTQEIPTAAIGETEFSFTDEQVYFDLKYLYPAEFELEIKEEPDRVRYLHRYFPKDFIKPAVGLVISRSNAYASPEDRLSDVAFIDQVTPEEINGVPWVIGTKSDSSVMIFSRAAGGYVYTFSFSTDYPEDFDYEAFARVFIQYVSDAE